jgi:hypothetical protein
MLPKGKIQAMPGVNCWHMALRVDKISAVTFRVSNMKASVRFYRDVLGMEIIFGGKTLLSLRFVLRTAACLSLIWSKVIRFQAGDG